MWRPAEAPARSRRSGLAPIRLSKAQSYTSSTSPRERLGLRRASRLNSTIVKCRFEPEVQVVRAGRVDVVNGDPVLHNTHGHYGKRTAFNLALPNEGQRIPVELPRPGTVFIDCDAHGWMEGWIYVVDNPYYAITGADGKFTISDVPPGDYKLVAVQSFTGPIEMPVTVKAGESTKLEIELKQK